MAIKCQLQCSALSVKGADGELKWHDKGKKQRLTFYRIQTVAVLAKYLSDALHLTLLRELDL